MSKEYINTNKHGKNQFFELPQYSPAMPIGEDEESLTEHQSWLRLQHRRCIQDFDGIKTRMNLTLYKEENDNC